MRYLLCIVRVNVRQMPRLLSILSKIFGQNNKKDGYNSKISTMLKHISCPWVSNRRRYSGHKKLMLMFEIPREQAFAFIFYVIVYVALWNFSICTWACKIASFDSSASFKLTWIIRSLCLSLSLSMSVWLPIYPSAYLSIRLWLCLSLSLFMHPSIHPYVRPCVCLSYLFMCI